MSLDFEHFIGLNAIPEGALFHPDGQKYLFSSGALAVVGDLLDPHSQEFLRGHDDNITAITLSKSGALFATGQRGGNADILVWDFASRRLLYRLEEHDHSVQALAFSEDGKILASVGSSDDGNLIFWDMSNGCIISSAARIPQGTTCITFAGFVRDIKRRDTSHYQAFTGGKDGVMLVWDLDPYSGELQQTRIVTDSSRANITRHICSFAVSTDYENIYAGSTSGDYLIISMRNHRIVRVVSATRMAINSILYTKGDLVILGCGDKGVKLYTAQGDFIKQVDLDGSVLGMSLSTDQLEVLATTSFGSIVRLNLQSLQQLVISEAHTQSITQVAFDQGNLTRFATVSHDGTIKVWDVTEYAVISTCIARREQKAGVKPLCLVFADIIFSGWSDGRVLAFSAETGENLWMLVDAHVGTSNRDAADEENISGVTSMMLSHNRRFLLTGGPTGDVRLWELRTRELISHLKEHKQRITRIVLSRDDTAALSASRDRCVLRWDLRSEKRTVCHMQRMGGINDIVLVGNDESFLISVGQDRKLVLWDTRFPDPLHAEPLDAEQEADEGFAVALTQDGKYLVVGGTQGVLRLYAVDSEMLRNLRSSKQPHQQLQQQQQHGRGLVSPFRRLQVVPAHSKAITSVQFNLQDKQVVSVGEDGSIFLFFFFSEHEV